ncbi:Fe-S oxidoreductase [Polaromonas sp. CF318]|uniref:glycolate oxidase subunit GlcF n=1 Tax=Polaromonas sp. CF318 TaxID=1144318 RepID=UPI000270DB5F|nr:glycolate oxidase subunit GlcF [Polaromonas sp. CF318]EJL82766.1 Fe-S oxidoreductase [Polaromonas sp. CF318]
MQTNFSPDQLADVHIAEADKILKSCQHYGFCTSGCPTYVLLHDENDSPRGRIDLIKEMLESGPAPRAQTVAHLDRCLSCMSCMTTCAVQVDYMHLIDTARVHIEKTYSRPLPDRLLRELLAFVLPRPRLFAAMLALGRLGRPLKPLLPAGLRRLVDFIPPPAAARRPALTIYPAAGPRRWRVALLAGCVQPVIAPHINDATLRLLTRFGCEVVVPESAGCCGSLNLHMGKAEAARASARRNVLAWLAEMQGEGLDAIIVNASGCGTTVKDYGHLFLDNEAERLDAEKIAALCHDICEWLTAMALPEPAEPRRLRVTYHDACSLRNAQKVTAEPRALLRHAGFIVSDVPESHFCCGSAGTYNLLQADIARQLGERKASHIAGTRPQIIAAGNIGCLTQIARYSAAPIVHTVELLDWAHGGETPPALRDLVLQAHPPGIESPIADAAGSSQPIRIHPRGTATDAAGQAIW